MMSPQDTLRPHMLDKVNEVALAVVLRFKSLISAQKSHSFVLFCLRQDIKVLEVYVRHGTILLQAKEELQPLCAAPGHLGPCRRLYSIALFDEVRHPGPQSLAWSEA